MSTSNDTLSEALGQYASVPGVKRGQQMVEIEEKLAGPARTKYEDELTKQEKRTSALETGKASLLAQEEQSKTEAAKKYKEAVENDPDIIEAKRIADSRKAFIPTKETAQDIFGLFTLTSILGAAVGKGAKGNAQQSMAAMNGMLEGHQKGMDDLYKKERQVFEINQKELDKKITDLIKFAEQNAKVRAADKELGEQQAHQKYLEDGATLVADIDKKFGPAKTIEHLKSLKEAVDRKANIMLGQIDEEQKAQRDLAKAKQLKLYEIELLEKRKISQMGTAGPQRAIYEATGKVVPSANEAKAIQSAASALRKVDDLRTRLQDPEIQTGLRALPSPLLSKIKSLVGSEEADVRKFVDKELTGIDKTTLFIKDAILMSLQIEQGLTGTRVPVFTQKVVGPVLDPRSYDPKTFDSVLASREKDLRNVGYDNGFSDEEFSNIARVQQVGTPAQSPAARSPAATPPAPANNPKPANAPADAKQALDNHWYSPDPNRPGKYIRWD